MSENTNTQMIIQVNDYLLTWIEGFLIDRKARGLTENTLLYYTRKLKQFNEFAETQAVTRLSQIDANLIRQFLLWLETTGHNPGGILTAFRAVKSFLLWYEIETDELTPIHKIKTPRVAMDPLEGVSLEIVMQMVRVCERGTFTGDRDISILLGLLDTGARAREFLSINLIDTNQTTGNVLIRTSKSRKPRTVYFGRKTRKAVRRYLTYRTDNNPSLWITRMGDRLTYSGLREIIQRRAKDIGIKPPALHSFRRGFAIMMLQSGTDIYTLAKLMGHATIDVLKHYLKLTEIDTAEAHRRASPVDHSFN
jgi:site-specific recombinase XerD